MMDTVISSVYAFVGRLGYHHPLHPTQVHIPIGLIVGAFILGVIGKSRPNTQFSRAAWYCLVMAMLFTIPTIVTGWMDWRHFFAGALILPFKVKLVFASLLLVLLVAGYFMGRGNGGTARGMMGVYTASLVTVVLLGYFGGELVFSGQKSAAPENYQAGMDLYVANCNGCHVDGGNVMKPDAPVRHSPKTEDYDTFLSWVRMPVSPMPAYPDTVLTDAEVKAIFDYISNVLNTR